MDARPWLAALRQETWLLADSASSDLAAPVPACPGWDVAECVRHCGSVFHRVADIVETGEVPDDWERAPAPDADLLTWYDAAAANLVAVLTARPPGTPVRGWYPPWTQLAFWIRRMAHEATVHRYDVQAAVAATAGSAVAPVDDTFAVDGLHEALECFLRFRGSARGVHGDGTCVLLRAADGPGEVTWAARLVADGVEFAVHDPAPDATVAGRASEVLLWLWGRLPAEAVTIDGDPAAVAKLRAAFRTAAEFEA